MYKSGGDCASGRLGSGTGASGKSLFAEPIVHLVQEDSEDDDGADDDAAVFLIDIQDDETGADHLDDQGTENGSEGGTFPAGKTCPADDGRGDDIEFVTGAVSRTSGTIVTDGEQRGDASGHS